MVSDEDFERVSQFRWYADVGRWTVYARRNFTREDGVRSTQLMHRFIMDVTDPQIQVDHRFHNGLDNQREKLRVATQSQNNKNQRVRRTSKTGRKGVSWCKYTKRYVAQYGGCHIGRFDCPKEAARHYNRAAFDNGDGFELLNDVDPLFPLAKYVKAAAKAENTRLRTEKHLEDVEKGLFGIKHVGVLFNKALGKWRVVVNKKHIGLYLTQDEAVSARNLAKSKQK